MKISLALGATLLTVLLLAPFAANAGSLDEQVEIDEAGEAAVWSYSPTTLTVAVGTTVTWKNRSSVAHSVTSRDQLFDSRLMDSGRSWSYDFETPGTFQYYCVPHPRMKATVVVTRQRNDADTDTDNSR